MTDSCDVLVDNPSQLYCYTDTPLLTQVKFLGSYRLPWMIDIAATFQSVPGPALVANYVATNAQIMPTLGRNLSAGATSTVSVNVIEPGSAYLDRMNQFDLRFARMFTLGSVRVKGMVDLFNAFNNAAVLVHNPTYGSNGSAWTPQQTLQGRLVKFEVQANF